jgi:glycolate oxidase iron-sulfur subunit
MRPLLPAVLAEKVPMAAGGAAFPGRGQRAQATDDCPRRLRAADPDAEHQCRDGTRPRPARHRVDRGAGCRLLRRLRYHLHAQEKALDDMRQVIDAWWPEVESGRVEGFVMTASGCGEHVREYGELLKHDPAYADKAARIAAMTRDASEVLAAEQDRLVELLRQAGAAAGSGERVAFHSPCTCSMRRRFAGSSKRCSRLPVTSFRRSPIRTCAAVRRAPIRSVSRCWPGSCATTSWRPWRRFAGGSGDRQHRLPDASAKRQHDAGAALDRADRRAFAAAS